VCKKSLVTLKLCHLTEFHNFLGIKGHFSPPAIVAITQFRGANLLRLQIICRAFNLWQHLSGGDGSAICPGHTSRTYIYIHVLSTPLGQSKQIAPFSFALSLRENDSSGRSNHPNPNTFRLLIITLQLFEMDWWKSKGGAGA